MRRRPYCLVVLDELEKAHPDVLGLLLQIMEEGVLTDSAGQRVSFRNAMVIMTSNAGGSLSGEGLGFLPDDREERRKEALRTAFLPEFLGRLDAVISFAPLKRETLEKIAENYLRELQNRTEKMGFALRLPGNLPEILCRDAPEKDGARQIRRRVQEQVEGPLALYLLGCTGKNRKIRGRWEENTLAFTAER